MVVSVCVEEETFEVVRGGGAFTFRITEFSRRRRFSVSLSIEEFRWLAVELVRFCSSKGDPFWVRTFRWKHGYWLLQLRKNSNGRFILLSHFTSSSQPRTLVFPKGPKPDGWFGVANLFKKVLIDANRAWSGKQKRPSRTGISKVSNNLSYADALRGRVGKPNSTILKGWRCRDCGSWHVCAALTGEYSGSFQVTP